MNAAHTAVSAASFQCEMMTEWARSVVKWYTVVRDMRVFLKAMTREWGPKTKRGSFFDPGIQFSLSTVFFVRFDTSWIQKLCHVLKHLSPGNYLT